MINIPIGIQCTNATFINNISKTYTYPFDWMFSTPKFVYEILILLLEKNMDINELVTQHFFLCDKRASYNSLEKYYTLVNGNSLYNTKYNVIFPHDTYDNNTIEKYIRRFERLKNSILNSLEDICFIYTSQSSLDIGNFTIDNKIVISNVYYHISNIYNLIKKYRNNFKIILFDSIQNEDKKDLNENIILYKLNKCNSWNDLLPQMQNYVNDFKQLV